MRIASIPEVVQPVKKPAIVVEVCSGQWVAAVVQIAFVLGCTPVV